MYARATNVEIVGQLLAKAPPRPLLFSPPFTFIYLYSY